MFRGKEVLLGVSGSIAAFKAAELARLLVKSGAKVQVVMTKNACEFVTPLTFFSLTGREVFTEMFSGGAEVATAHISLARQADLVIVAPASARTIARIALGSAEDLLSTAVIASHAPVVIAPAMNPQMYQHPGVQKNLETLSSWKQYYVAPSGVGEMACGEFGLGRLAEPQELVHFCSWVLEGGRQDLRGEEILVTAGATIEDIDPVRYLSNRSTGKMGFALAEVAAMRGAKVKLITSSRHLSVPPGCEVIWIRSAQEMTRAVHEHLPQATVLLMCAAVADYRPLTCSPSKIKKTDGDLSLTLTRTVDILSSLPPSPTRITVGFAAETHDVLHYAQNKMQKKQMNLIVANDVLEEGSGFGTETNRVSILFQDGRTPLSLPLMSKKQVAQVVLDQVLFCRAQKNEGVSR